MRDLLQTAHVPMWFMWVWSFIPWWGFVVAGLVLVVVFWQPIAAVWSILPRPVRLALAFLGSILVAVQYGRNKGQQVERDREADRDANAIQERDKIDGRVKNMSEVDVDRKLRDNRWLRP